MRSLMTLEKKLLNDHYKNVKMFDKDGIWLANDNQYFSGVQRSMNFELMLTNFILFPVNDLYLE